jgi:hypothetical protein
VRRLTDLAAASLAFLFSPWLSLCRPKPGLCSASLTRVHSTPPGDLGDPHDTINQ